MKYMIGAKIKVFWKKNSLRWPNWQSFLTGSTGEYASQDTKRIIPIGLATSEKSVNIHEKENMRVELRYISSSFSEVGITKYDIISFYTALSSETTSNRPSQSHPHISRFLFLINFSSIYIIVTSPQNLIISSTFKIVKLNNSTKKKPLWNFLWRSNTVLLWYNYRYIYSNCVICRIFSWNKLMYTEQKLKVL